ncbi:hypothetical protein Daus18300_006627 [Diaporthe australafricana]|uniref:Retinal pigment epithelial membrane protein n=1 Tax=Diaporthe australafricana TaxID=127596 RepID=A0ABR3WSZ3_9PEZI
MAQGNMNPEAEGLIILQSSRQHPYLSGNFAPIKKTTPLTPCSYSGSVPLDLGGGQYVRNGGNPVTNDDLGRDAHWFDGDGMLSGVLFRKIGEKGTTIQPEFVNQFLLTDVYAYAKRSAGPAGEDDRSLRRPVLPSIATLVNPTLGVFTIVWAIFRTIVLVVMSHLSRVRYPIKKISVANTSVLYHDGRALALCESGPPLRFALPGLETIGWFNGRSAENESGHRDSSKRGGFGGSSALSFMKEWTTAHPRVDPVTKELIAFHSVFIKPFCYYSIVPPSQPKLSTLKPHSAAPRFSMPVPGVTAPKMMHDFGASRNHTVILDLPLTLDPSNLARGVPVLSYDSRGKARYGVFPRYRPDLVQWFETNPCVIFHTANCWDTITHTGTINGTEIQETSVNLLASRLTSASLVFSAGNLPTPAVKPVPPEYAEEEQCRLYYYNFPLSANDGTDMPGHRIRHQWALSAISFEFPTLSPNHSMSEARYVYGCSTGYASYTVALGKAAKIDYLAKIDVKTLIERGVQHPPQPIRGCVDTRSVAEIQASGDPNDHIKLFKMPEGWFAQEPRFVPRKESERRSEDDGWLLTYVFDESQLDADGECDENAISELWIIDAMNMKDVVARVKLPHRVPYGLHGSWFPEEEINAQRPFTALRTLDGQDEGAFSRSFRGMIERWLG